MAGFTFLLFSYQKSNQIVTQSSLHEIATFLFKDSKNEQNLKKCREYLNLSPFKFLSGFVCQSGQGFFFD